MRMLKNITLRVIFLWSHCGTADVIDMVVFLYVVRT